MSGSKCRTSQRQENAYRSTHSKSQSLPGVPEGYGILGSHARGVNTTLDNVPTVIHAPEAGLYRFDNCCPDRLGGLDWNCPWRFCFTAAAESSQPIGDIHFYIAGSGHCMGRDFCLSTHCPPAPVASDYDCAPQPAADVGRLHRGCGSNFEVSTLKARDRAATAQYRLS